LDLTGPDRATKTIYAGSYAKRCQWFETHPDRVLEHLWGGNVSLRRAHALKVGLEFGFDIPQVPDARFYQQDRAFGLRCRAEGLVGVYDPSLRAEHRYNRDLVSHRRDIRGRAFSGRILHDVFPSVLGPLETDPILKGGAGSRLLRRAGAGSAYRPLAALFTLLARGARWLRLSRVEGDIVRAFNPLETGRGLRVVGQALSGRTPLQAHP
jgi:hypothetical protein